jgi:hypothetical protein
MARVAARDTEGALTRRWFAGAARIVARHPSLWSTGARQALVLARRGWWRRRPFLPLPDASYLRFRLQTAYGGTGADREPEPDDLVTYLRWCRETRPIWRPERPGRN